MASSENAVHSLDSAGVPATMRYRPDIDGMRAIAVAAVVVYHNFPALWPSGFIGVDIFFVLSGYLISTVIFTGLAREEFSFAGFYSRRIRRIFPALAVVLAFTLAAGWWILAPHAWQELAKNVLGGAGFVSNLLHPSGDNYFDPGAARAPLMHLWSLGIEEQFYLIWPLALFALWKLAGNGRRGAMVLGGIVLVAGASFAQNLRLLRIDDAQQSAFFSPLARAWELMAGAALARIMMIQGEVRRRWAAELWTAAGVALLVAAFALLDAGKPLPGPWTILPVAGTVLLIWAGSEAWLQHRVLASRLLVGLGLISYPLYLWHWVLLAFFRIFEDSSIRLGPRREAAARLVLIMLALILAWATYRFVETPMRFSTALPSAFRVKALLAGMAFVAIMGALSLGTIEPRLHSAAIRELERARTDFEWLAIWKMAPMRTYDFPSSGSKKASLMVGDSHMEQYIPRARAAIKANPNLNTAVFATSGLCAPLPGINQAEPGFRCPEFYEYWNVLARESRFSTIAISVSWSSYGPWMPDTFHGHRAMAADFDEAWTGLAADLRSLIAKGKRVVVFDDNPYSDTFDPATGLAPLHFSGLLRLSAAPRAKIERELKEVTRRLQELQRQSGVEIVHVRDYLCDKVECPAVDADGSPIYLDNSHLRASEAAKLATYVDDALKP